MKKIFLSIQFAALMAGLPAFALVGGPFDNGEYSVLLERSGVYEAAFSFDNGSGYSQWTADQSLGDSSTGGTTTANQGPGSLLLSTGRTNNANRTVLYYKGVTYVGSAMGQTDTQARTIQGSANTSSEYTLSTTQTTQQSSLLGLNASSSQSASTEIIVLNGRGYIANVNWTGKITDTSAQMRFSGEGELTIISSSGSEAIANLAYSGYANLIQSISTSVSNSGGANSTPNYPGAVNSIAQILNGTGGTPAIINPTYAQATDATGTPVDVNGDGIFNNDLVQSGQTVTPAVAATPSLASYLNGTGPENSYEESVTEKVKVTGYRRFF